jgi:hypothetical protein
MLNISAEAFAALVFGAISILVGSVLPMIPFWWHLGCAVLFVLVVMDLCLRSKFVKQSVTQHPSLRLLLSVIALLVIGRLLWNPLRKEYALENSPPSFAYLTGGWINRSTMIFSWHHYGPNPANNIHVEFTDVDRRLITNKSHDTNGGVSLQLFAQDHRFFHLNEIDPSMAGADEFTWQPLNFNRQTYDVIVRCREGKFEEQLWFATNSAGGLLQALRLKRIPIYSTDEKEKTLFECLEPGFPSDRPNLPSPSISCYVADFTHLGELHLPLQPPTDPNAARMRVAIMIYAFLVFLAPYSLLALWWMGESDLFVL